MQHHRHDACRYIFPNVRHLLHLAGVVATQRDMYYAGRVTAVHGCIIDSWNLTLFLQSRNPNIPNIPNKLTRPVERAALTRQHRFWNDVIKIGGNVHCIYSGNALHVGDYAIDHFMPWSFVAHDQLWNLIPADISVNSSKSDRLPILEKYLPRLAEEHRNAIVGIFTQRFA